LLAALAGKDPPELEPEEGLAAVGKVRTTGTTGTTGDEKR
jgi:hypothetical protein